MIKGKGTQEMKVEEKRRDQRVKLRSEVVVSNNGDKFKGVLTDLSMNGAFIKVNSMFKPYDSINVSITIKKDDINLSTSIKGVVNRKDNDGIAIHFMDMNLSSFKVIRDIAKIYAVDESRIENDLKKMNIKSAIH